MSERVWTTIDKSAWGPGPWQDEPDKVQWVDEATGLDCLVVRVPAGGHLCGYVGVPPGHPWHGREYGYYDGDPDSQVDVHGGLTYSDSCQQCDDESRGVCHVAEDGAADDVWWFGFDCAHLDDLSPGLAPVLRSMAEGDYKDVGYVRREVAYLARQLAEVAA